jgi:hypothetical protein
LRKKYINIPNEIMYYSACALMCYWTCLYPEATQQAINEGVDLMIHTVIKLLGKQNKRRCLMLSDGTYSSDEEVELHRWALLP